MNEKRFATLDLLLALTLACCIARLWIMPLGSSFWVDEMGTYFLVHHADDPCLPTASRPVAEGLAWCEYRDAESSIYYALPKFAEKIAGVSEAGYRFFSVLAMLAALAVIGLIAARLIHPHAAWFAVFACMASRGFNYQADDARPYALGTFILAASVLLLVRWLDNGRWRDGLIFSGRRFPALVGTPDLLAVLPGLRRVCDGSNPAQRNARGLAAGRGNVRVDRLRGSAGCLPRSVFAAPCLHARHSRAAGLPPVPAVAESQLCDPHVRRRLCFKPHFQMERSPHRLGFP